MKLRAFFTVGLVASVVQGYTKEEQNALVIAQTNVHKVSKFFCSSSCAIDSAGPCQFKDLANNVCLPFTEDGKCFKDMIVCGDREMESKLAASAYLDFIRVQQGSTAPEDVCSESCHPMTGGMCQYPNGDNDVCFPMHQDGNYCKNMGLEKPCCSVGMVDCSHVLAPSVTVSGSPEPSPTPSRSPTTSVSPSPTTSTSTSPTRSPSISLSKSLTPVWQATWQPVEE